MTFTFSPSELNIVNAYKSVLQGDKDTQQLMDAYPLFVRLLKFKYEMLHKSIIYLNRYLVATIVDDATLTILAQNLEVYLTMKETNYVSWKTSRDIINALLENEDVFYQNIIRDRNVVASKYTDNINDDDKKFQTILKGAEIDDGRHPMFVDFVSVSPAPADANVQFGAMTEGFTTTTQIP